MKEITKQELARQGESVSAKYLENKGYRILNRNFRASRCEIDLIVEKDQQLIFVEVKTRSYHTIDSAVENITYRKIRNISRTALQYINQNPALSNHNTRFDVIIALYNKREDSFRIHHFEDAFLPILDGNRP